MQTHMAALEAMLAILSCSNLVTDPASTDLCQARPETPVTPFVLAPMRGGDATTTDHETFARLDESVSWRRGRMSTYVPSGFWPSNGKYDLVIHFHGVQTRTEPAFESVGFENAVLVTINLGIGSTVYEGRFAPPESFPQLLSSIEADIARQELLGSLEMGRIAVSGWSAGYGAIRMALQHPENSDRIDAVLLADGLHAGFMDPHGRIIRAPFLTPFVAFAKAAVDGSKLLAVSHSDISTRGYASTTETARYLSSAVGLAPELVNEEQVGSMNMISRVERGGLRIHGYAGSDATAHIDHLAHIDETLYRQLRNWWAIGVPGA